MHKLRNRLAALTFAAVMVLPLAGCEDFAAWEERTANDPAYHQGTHIDVPDAPKGPSLADYVNQGVQDAKDRGLYTESDYSGILIGGGQGSSQNSGTDGQGSSQNSGTGQAGSDASGQGVSGTPGQSGPGTEQGGTGSGSSGGPGSSDMSGHGVSSAMGKEQYESLSARLAGTEYDGTPSIEVNGGIPYFTEEELMFTEAFEYYSELDDLGRTQYAFALLNESLMPEDGEERGDISGVRPSGWVQAKYDGIGNGGWLYNRCHLIAWSLAGENDNERNLMTGTRGFNVDGMLPYEVQVLKYVDANPDSHVLYRATPMYEEDSLLAKGLLLEAWSVEDEGELCFCVYVFNAQPGVSINYADGTSFAAGQGGAQ